MPRTDCRRCGFPAAVRRCWFGGCAGRHAHLGADGSAVAPVGTLTSVVPDTRGPGAPMISETGGNAGIDQRTPDAINRMLYPVWGQRTGRAPGWKPPRQSDLRGPVIDASSTAPTRQERGTGPTTQEPDAGRANAQAATARTAGPACVSRPTNKATTPPPRDRRGTARPRHRNNRHGGTGPGDSAPSHKQQPPPGPGGGCCACVAPKGFEPSLPP